MVGPGQLDDYTRGYIDAFGEFEHPRLAFPGVVEEPGETVYAGPVVILVDDACASACEDFALPFASSGRGTLVGEPTSGSTGQPYMWTFDNGMSFRVSARRVSMPDGAPFEGVGIVPDVEVRPTSGDLRSGRDPVLETAREIARREI
jgi:carboxyl-terminal processing protease